MNKKVYFTIDEKSLFYGLSNDYSKGQTATASTPLNQAKNSKKWKNDILNLRKYKCRYNKKIPARLEHLCLYRSKALKTEVSDLFVFSNLLLDGKKLKCDYQFCFYFKKENSDVTNNGKMNTHKGRIKLHYPQSMYYKDEIFNIDNEKVLESILVQNGGFAFIVRAFEYDIGKNTLNFITSDIGPAGMPLTAIFSRKKGVGKKYVRYDYNPETIDYLISLQNYNDEGTLVSIKKANITRDQNGKLGEERVLKYLENELKIPSDKLYHVSKDHSFSPYDIEYRDNKKITYIEVKSTQSDKISFYLSPGEMKFMEKNKDNYELYIVTNVRDINYKIQKKTYRDIKKMKSKPTSARYYI